MFDASQLDTTYGETPGISDLNLLDGHRAEGGSALVRGKRWLLAAGFHMGLNVSPAMKLKAK